ncbi:MAG: serine/threonine protein kinase [Planctomycetia bacterium]|nr:serine/threonine protein kinase [Planctomycetia bacterium]
MIDDRQNLRVSAAGEAHDHHDRLVTMLHATQRERWAGGERLLVERLLDRYPTLRDSPEHAVDLIYGEFLIRSEMGEKPTADEYARRFPHFAGVLCQQMELDDALSERDDAIEVRKSRDATSDVQATAERLRWVASQQGLDNYEILGELGRGGTGVVYKARDRRLGRTVALKLLWADSGRDAAQVERLQIEAEVVARLSHPNIVHLYDVLKTPTHDVLVLEYVDGGSLHELLRMRTLSARTSAALMALLARAMHYAHAHGVLHRDLKPANILFSLSTAAADTGKAPADLLSLGWTPKIADFGLAKRVGAETSGAANGDPTHTGDLLGTPGYLAPEQALGKLDEIGPVSDVYALGAVLYELLVGRPPFRSETVLGTLQQVICDDPIAPSRVQRGLPRDVETICLKCLAKDPRHRYASAVCLAEDLDRFLAGRPILARRTRLWEKAYRWCRRNPAVTSLSALLFLVIAVGFAGVLWKWRDAEAARRGEWIARQESDARATEIRQGLVRLKSASALLDQGRFCAEMHYWDDAEAAFAKVTELLPDSADGWEARGHLYAGLGLWELAAVDLARAFDLKEPRIASRWWQLAVARLYVNDTAGCRRIAERMPRRFVDTNNVAFACELVRTSVVSRDPGEAPEQWVALQEETVARAARGPWFLYVLGLAHCRAHQYEKAILRCRESLMADAAWASKPLNYAVLAIAYQELGQANDARQALDSAAAAIDRWTRDKCAGGTERWAMSQGATGHWPIDCWDWLECQVLFREARERLALPLPEPDPRIHLLRGRSFAGLRRFNEAEAEYATALELRPGDVQTLLESYRVRGYLHVRRKEWNDAAAAFASAAQLQPDDVDLWKFQALAFLAGDQMADFRRACSDMLERFEGTQDKSSAYDVVHACMLTPDSISDMKRLIPLARLGAAHYTGGARLLGSVLYRVGEFEQAIEQIRQASNVSRLRAADWCFLAMAHQQLGHSDDAGRCLAEAKSWIDQSDLRKLDQANAWDPVWGAWHERATTLRLLREAEALMGSHANAKES